jgi:hypothetical protein
MIERLTHISFATSQMSGAADVLVASAYAHGVDNVWVYSPSHPAVLRAVAENPEIADHARGAGYWIWKAHILLDAMEHVPDGELLFYTDAGISYVDDPQPVFALAQARDIVLFNFTELPGTHRYRTKRDTLVLLGADNARHWDEQLVQAGTMIFRVNPRTRAFVWEWRDAMRDPRVLTDMPNSCGLDNFPEFQTHMHDMSVITVLATQHGIPRTRFPGIPPRPEDEGGYPRVLYRHALRNPGAPYYVSLAAEADAARREATPSFLHGGNDIDRKLISTKARDTCQRWRDRKPVLPDDFDPQAYSALHPEVALNEFDPAFYYLEWGKALLDRLPPDFDDAVYLRLHPDVAAVGVSAAYHYVTFGCREGRRYSDQAK